MNLTHEQQEVVAALDRRERLKVYALAGTGKTSTLKAIAEQHPEQRMLYLAFNRAIADEAPAANYPPDSRIRNGGVAGARCDYGNIYRRRRPDGMGYRYLDGHRWEGWPEKRKV